MSTGHSLLSFVALACLVLTRDDAWAQSTRQERLFAVLPVQQRIVEIDTAADTFGRILSSTHSSVPLLQPMVVTGGRFLVGIDSLNSSSSRLGVFDTRLLVGREVPLTGHLLALDTHRPRVFLAEIIQSSGFGPDLLQLKVLDLGTGAISSTALAPFNSQYGVSPRAAYAGLVDRLFLQRWPDRTIVDVVDVAAGSVVQSIDIGVGLSSSEPVDAIVTDTTGSRLFVLTVPHYCCSSVPVPARLSVFDVATGALITRGDVGDAYFEPALHNLSPVPLRLDEERGRLLVGAVIVFDAATLQRLGATSGAHGNGSSHFAFTGPRSPVIIFSSHYVGGRFAGDDSKCVRAQLERRNAATGALEAVVDIGAATGLSNTTRRTVGCWTDMMMATVPRAPQHLAGAVNGRQVTLSWIDPGNTTHFDIEAGSAPGLANLLSRAVSGTTFTVDGVPSGRYYVRVRAINDVGRSVPTSDVAIIVP